MTEYHAHRRKVLLANLITLGPNKTRARATLQDHKIAPHDYEKNRVGRKRKNCSVVTIAQFWGEVRQTYAEARGLSDCDPDNRLHVTLMRQLAQQYNDEYHFVRRDGR